MRRLTVLAQALAMIGGRQHDHRVGRPRPLDRVEKHADLGIGKGDLAIVRPPAEAAQVRLGRRVGRMRIEQVQPEEERPGPVLRRGMQPCQGRADGRIRPALDVGQCDRIVAARKCIVVDVEAAPEAESPVDRKARHEGGRVVARALELLGQRRRRGAENELGVVADAVHERRDAGQDGRVRGQRQRDVHDGGREAHAARRQCVKDRRGCCPIAVTAERDRRAKCRW